MRTRLSLAIACGVLSIAGQAVTSHAQEAPAAVEETPGEVGSVRIDASLIGEPGDLRWSDLGQRRAVLRVVPAPQDRETYGDAYDYGSWSGTSYSGETDLPAGYWVYRYPNWYILGEEVPPVVPGPAAPGAEAWPSWHPMHATGAPDTLQYGDYGTAWASLSQDDQPEWLDLTYGDAVPATAVLVFESYNPGAIKCVRIWDAAGNEQIVWEGASAPPSSAPAIYSFESRKIVDEIEIESSYNSANSVTARVIPLRAGTTVSRVRIDLDSRTVPGWNEIDAVGLLTLDGQVRWATGAEASSTYADWGQASPPPAVSDPSPVVEYNSESWAPSQATGAPNTLEAGDYVTAWAPLSQDEQAEWLDLTYEAPVAAAAVLVHESYNPGALRKVTGWSADSSEEITLWEGVDPTSPHSASGVSIIPVPAGVGPLVRVRLHLDSPAVPGWNEIDAVGLLDAAGQTHWAVGATASSSYAERYKEQGEVFLQVDEVLGTDDNSGSSPATIIIRAR